MNRLFNDSVSGRGREDDLMNRGTWTPAVDIYEDDGGLVLKAEVARHARVRTSTSPSRTTR